MGFFGRLFGGKGAGKGKAVEQAVLVQIDTSVLSEDVLEKCDLMTIEDRLIEVIESAGVGRFDGNEVGADDATLFMYGPDAEALFRVVEPVLRDYPLTRLAKVVIQTGGPGGAERTVQLG